MTTKKMVLPLLLVLLGTILMIASTASCQHAEPSPIQGQEAEPLSPIVGRWLLNDGMIRFEFSTDGTFSQWSILRGETQRSVTGTWEQVDEGKYKLEGNAHGQSHDWLATLTNDRLIFDDTGDPNSFFERVSD